MAESSCKQLVVLASEMLTHLLQYASVPMVQMSGNLTIEEVAVKRMTATKTKEFIAEMKLLCKVHHRNLRLAALKHSPDSMSMSGLKDHIDPNLLDLFPHDCVFKMATLAKQCVKDDPILRPDLKQIVISLSHILLSSVEWETNMLTTKHLILKLLINQNRI
ncbi:hypothetical protein L1987_41551 [Smallanthus sonchifolius]|uniref:Uncharacterized protein n=1 Tax=Smallanthus sonchifolius TaxID=185202 RepID=A0ACB9GVI7_9ASTR|nr:hypothetical protein L1987_41551 [Smallanthus sonchifolius]